MQAAAEHMGLPPDTEPCVTMDDKSHQLAAVEVFDAFTRGDVPRAVIDGILAAEAGHGPGQVRPAFQGEIVSRLHRWTGKTVC